MVLVLEKLCQISVQNKFRFKKPQIKEDGGAMMEEAEDDGGDDMGGDDIGGDLADMANQDLSDDEDIADFAEPEGDLHNQEDLEDKAIIHSNVTREEWLIECERVAHKLKLGKVANDGKEWRAHLDQTKKFAGNVYQHLPDVRSKLERLSDDVSKALERISKKEQLLSRSFEGMTGDYQAHSAELKDVTNRFETVSKNVGDMEAELMEINDKLREMEDSISAKTDGFSNTSHLQNMKKAIGQVKQDIKAMDMRIGIVSNTLLQLKLKQKTRSSDEETKNFEAMGEVVDENFA